jgi:hypothetical protein
VRGASSLVQGAFPVVQDAFSLVHGAFPTLRGAFLAVQGVSHERRSALCLVQDGLDRVGGALQVVQGVSAEDGGVLHEVRSATPVQAGATYARVGAMHPVVGLLHDARGVLQVTQNGLGEMLGASRRTAQRWAAGASFPSAAQLASLAALVHPREPALAAQLAEAAGSSLERLGIVPPVTGPSAALMVDSVVCAAAEAMDALPRVVRPALLAAVRRARQLGLTLEAVEAALVDSTSPPRASE